MTSSAGHRLPDHHRFGHVAKLYHFQRREAQLPAIYGNQFELRVTDFGTQLLGSIVSGNP